jgi:hypothetical protein
MSPEITVEVFRFIITDNLILLTIYSKVENR